MDKPIHSHYFKDGEVEGTFHVFDKNPAYRCIVQFSFSFATDSLFEEMKGDSESFNELVRHIAKNIKDEENGTTLGRTLSGGENEGEFQSV